MHDSDKILISYNRDVKSTLELRNLGNGTFILDYPLEAGTIQSTQGKREDHTFFFKVETFTDPGMTYKLEFGEKGEIPMKPKVFRKTEFNGLDTTKLETNQVFYESKDGTIVPMFIVHRKVKGHQVSRN